MTEAKVTENPGTDSAEASAAAAGVTETAVPLESNTPGSILRRTREARGQSIADVVHVIRFSVRQIEALERDDYASLPGPTAVRGLVRNYSRFLKLDAAPLLAQLDPAVPVPEADVRPPANMGEAEQPTIAGRIPPKLVVAGVLILSLLLAGYWHFTMRGDGSLTQRPDGADGGTTVAAPGQVRLPASAPAAGTVNDPVNVGAAGSLPPGSLRVEFDDRSWIEIRDATQKIVFVGEYPAGTRQNIEGEAPFQIWIGKASGVRLYMGERNIDLKPHTREEVARFNLE